jgi:hypothetical protein
VSEHLVCVGVKKKTHVFENHPPPHLTCEIMCIVVSVVVVVVAKMMFFLSGGASVWNWVVAAVNQSRKICECTKLHNMQ